VGRSRRTVPDLIGTEVRPSVAGWRRCATDARAQTVEVGRDARRVRGGLVGSRTGARGVRLKSKSLTMFAQIFSSSRTSGRGSGGRRSSVSILIRQKVVLDEFEIGVARERLVVDGSPPCVGEITMAGPAARSRSGRRGAARRCHRTRPSRPTARRWRSSPSQDSHGGIDHGGDVGLTLVHAGRRCSLSAWTE